jgi:hypothetical protein
MPKTLPIASPDTGRTRLAPIALFALAYLAILGVLFAPDGFFLSDLPGQGLAVAASD